MEASGRILLADDEETFLQSTADLLRREGYECTCVEDGHAAVAMLRKGEHDLLIADIKMPGNPELELVRGLQDIAKSIPVILVTGYPSLRSAMDSIQLPVVAYMVKPVEFEDLLVEVRRGIDRVRVHESVRTARKRLAEWRHDMHELEEMMSKMAPGASAVHVATFLEMSLHNILNSLTDMKNLVEATAGRTAGAEVCHLFSCPRVQSLTESIEEAIIVLNETKSSFKSKKLAELRRKLEGVLKSGNARAGAGRRGSLRDGRERLMDAKTI